MDCGVPWSCGVFFHERGFFFAEEAGRCPRTESEILVAKNLEVETAVEDLISELARYPM